MAVFLCMCTIDYFAFSANPKSVALFLKIRQRCIRVAGKLMLEAFLPRYCFEGLR